MTQLDWRFVGRFVPAEFPEGLDPQGLGVARACLSRAMFLDVGDMLGGSALT